MKSNYKLLGPFIREVYDKNSQNQIEKLLGVSIQKCFIPSIANTIGTDMSTYKIVREGQFAYGPVTSRNGEKISVALLQESDCIVSTSYTVFEIVDPDILLPEYLMMWFRRPEFDRYARYMSHGSVREIFGWDEMCGVELPIPPIEKQKEIVAEYHTIVNRIKLNEELNRKLEETAQAIYKQWFVDFEFPYDIAQGKPDLNGKPYKSSGGEMVTCVLGKIPKGNWFSTNLGYYVKLSQGLVINSTTAHLIKTTGIPLLRITDLINETKEIYIDESVDKKNISKTDDIIISRTGQVGLVFRNKEGVIHNNCFKVTPDEKVLRKDYLYRFLKKKSTYNLMVELATGSSAQCDLTHTAFNTLPIILPPVEIQDCFSAIIVPIERTIVHKNKENILFRQFRDIFLSKLAS